MGGDSKAEYEENQEGKGRVRLGSVEGDGGCMWCGRPGKLDQTIRMEVKKVSSSLFSIFSSLCHFYLLPCRVQY